MRNLLTTGTLAGLAESVTLHNQGPQVILGAIPSIPWMQAMDVILVSNLYFIGWSSLTVRGWMYKSLFIVAGVAALRVIAELRRPAIAWMAGLYSFFWLGQLYNVILQFLTKGLAGSMGWYLCAAVGCQVALCCAGFRKYGAAMAAVGSTLFALLDLYGMHALAIPYYSGWIAHNASGSLPALHLNRFPIGATWSRMPLLWPIYVAATLLPMILALRNAKRAFDENRTGVSPAQN